MQHNAAGSNRQRLHLRGRLSAGATFVVCQPAQVVFAASVGSSRERRNSAPVIGDDGSDGTPGCFQDVVEPATQTG
jgi:hypothetical protein